MATMNEGASDAEQSSVVVNLCPGGIKIAKRPTNINEENNCSTPIVLTHTPTGDDCDTVTVTGDDSTVSAIDAGTETLKIDSNNDELSVVADGEPSVAQDGEAEANVTPFRILKRNPRSDPELDREEPLMAGSSLEEQLQENERKKTLEQREAAYAAARKRILGSAQDGEFAKGSEETLPATAPVQRPPSPEQVRVYRQPPPPPVRVPHLHHVHSDSVLASPRYAMPPRRPPPPLNHAPGPRYHPVHVPPPMPMMHSNTGGFGNPASALMNPQFPAARPRQQQLASHFAQPTGGHYAPYNNAQRYPRLN